MNILSENILVDALCPLKVWSAKGVKWSIVTRAHAPRHLDGELEGLELRVAVQGGEVAALVRAELLGLVEVEREREDLQ